MRSTTFIRLHSSLFYSVHLCMLLCIVSKCVVYLLCIFAISRSVDCRRKTDTREGRREEIRGEGRKDRREICPSHEFSKVSHDETLNQLLQNALKLTYSKVKSKKNSGVTPVPPLQGRRGGKGRKGEWMKGKSIAPHLFIQVYAYETNVEAPCTPSPDLCIGEKSEMEVINRK